MVRKAKKPAKKKTSAKRPAKKKASAKKVAKKQIRKVKSVRKTTLTAAQVIRRKTIAAKKAGKGIVRRAVEAIAQVAAPLLPGSATEKPEGD